MSGNLAITVGGSNQALTVGTNNEIFNAAGNAGLYFGSGDFRFYTNGSGSQYRFEDATKSFSIGKDTAFGWRNVTDTGAGSLDITLFRDAANTLAQRQGVNPQTKRLYNTFTDVSNGEWLEMTWSGNLATISTKANGTGTLRVFNLGASSGGNVGQLWVDYTNTATVGNVTINKAAGRVNMAALGATFTVTNSLVTAASHIFLNADGAPGNAVAVQLYAVPAAGSFTVNAVPAVTNQTAIDFFVVNAD